MTTIYGHDLERAFDGFTHRNYKSFADINTPINCARCNEVIEEEIHYSMNLYDSNGSPMAICSDCSFREVELNRPIPFELVEDC